MCLATLGMVSCCAARHSDCRFLHRLLPPQLSQLEGELSKVKATIKELDTEVTALKGERSQAVGILQEIQTKLRVSARC